jgi:nucleoside-diphosphate-sugar epimerase
MRVLITGGGGFLGQALARRLRARGAMVQSLSRRRYPALDALHVAQFAGDIADRETVRRSVEGCDLVFHVAAKAGIWGPRREYEQVNVLGTENVIAACRAAGVPRLVHTSSPSVVFAGRDIENADESLPYPARYEADYPRTKAEAERAVLAANDAQLATVALRPHLIWGPGDNHLTPRLLARARAGQLRRIGGISKCIDSTYIDNAADAHVLAADRLGPGAACAGRAYFISNGEPMPLWDLVNGILAAAGLPPVTCSVPYTAAWAAAVVLETAYTVLGRADEPRLTRFLLHELTTAHWFNLSAARRDLGYAPAVSIAEGLKRLAQSLRGGRTQP